MTRWEYRTFRVDFLEEWKRGPGPVDVDALLTERMNVLGAEGWEIFKVEWMHIPDVHDSWARYVFIGKRPVYGSP